MREHNTIKLLVPQNDSVTPPLQQWSLPEDWSGASVEPIRWNDLHVVSEDRSLPRVVSFAWEARTHHEDSLSYELAISRNVNIDEPFILSNLSEPKAEVRHLHIAARYFWRVTAICSGQRVAVSPVSSFTTNSTPPRWIAVPGITNVRDIGGWPLPGNRMVKQGVIYRSSEMNDHIDITEDGKEILIHELGIRTDLDLRENPKATPALDTRIVRWINIPVVPYKDIFEVISRESYCRIFETFADASNYPILFHCWGGADRGGTLSFLLGALLGMRMNDLIHDYELTSLSIWGVRYRESDEFRGLLDVLARFGNSKDDINTQVENYLQDVGLTEKHIACIRKQCVVPDHLFRAETC